MIWRAATEPAPSIAGMFHPGEYARLTGHYRSATALSLPGTYTTATGKVLPKRRAKYVSSSVRSTVSGSEENCADHAWMVTPWKLARAQALNMRCYLCAEPLEGIFCNLDHVIPRSAGGSHAQANMLVTHVACNTNKADRMPTKRELACLDAVNERLGVLTPSIKETRQ